MSFLIADKVMLGTVVADRVYYGSELVWPTYDWQDFTPTTLYFRNDGDEPAGLSLNTMTAKPHLEYTTNGTEWHSWNYSEILIPAGRTLALRGSNNRMSTSNTDYSNFVTSKPLYCEGSIQSLLDKTGTSKTIPTDYCFFGLFQNSKITHFPVTNATELKKGCYWNLFYNCTNANYTAHSLPATTIPENAYRNMFFNSGVTGLVSKIPSSITVTGSNAFNAMFKNCSKLTNYPLAASATFDLGGQYYHYALYEMFKNCTSLKTIGNITTSKSSCVHYTAAYMFYGCTGLTDLSSYTFSIYGYTTHSYAMAYCFAECKGITAGPIVYSGGAYAKSHCFQNCTNMVTAPKFEKYDYMSLDTAEEAEYEYIFAGCTKLESVYFSEYYAEDNAYRYACQNCKALKTLKTRITKHTNGAHTSITSLDKAHSSYWTKIFTGWVSGAGTNSDIERGYFAYMSSAILDICTLPAWGRYGTGQMSATDGRGSDPEW